MKKVVRILLIVIVAFLGFTIGRSTVNNIMPTEVVEKKEFPLPPAPPDQSLDPEETMGSIDEKMIILEVPVDGSTIRENLRVEGRADAENERIVIILQGEDDEPIHESEVQVTSIEDGFGRFSEDIHISVVGLKSAELIIVGYDEDDEETGEITRTLFFETGDTVAVDIYFINESAEEEEVEGHEDELTCYPLVAVKRQVSSKTAIYRSALEELLRGPSSAEKQLGYETGVPRGVDLKDVGADAEGVVRANFTKLLDRNIYDECRLIHIREQITQTLEQFLEVREVDIAIEGKTKGVLEP